MEFNRDHQLLGYPYSSKYLLLFNRKMELIHVWNNLRVGVGDMTKILYHDNNIYHDIVMFFFYLFFYYIKIFNTI